MSAPQRDITDAWGAAVERWIEGLSGPLKDHLLDLRDDALPGLYEAFVAELFWTEAGMIYMGQTPANFAKVDDRLWRGARPTAEQAAWLVSEGVRTFLDIEWEQSDEALVRAIDGADRLRVACLRVRDFEPLPWFAPSIADGHLVIALAAILNEPDALMPGGQISPVYVHCRSGENRTGVIVAAYRLLVRGNSLPLVLDEFSKYRGLWAWGDRRYIKTIDERHGELLRRIAIVRNQPKTKGRPRR